MIEALPIVICIMFHWGLTNTSEASAEPLTPIVPRYLIPYFTLHSSAVLNASAN